MFRLATRRRLAAKAFAHTAAYDGLVAAYLSSTDGEALPRRNERFPKFLTIAFERAYSLRYGENPHQSGAFYRDRAISSGQPCVCRVRLVRVGKSFLSTISWT